MTGTHVALLRGVNVGGARKLPMAALRAALVEAGFEGVQTYVQSGNVVLSGDRGSADEEVAAQIRAVISAGFDLDVPVVVRRAEQLAAVVRANPFLSVEGATGTQLHVAFLSELPDPARAAAVDPDRAPPDRLAVIGTEVYLHCPDGLGRSKVLNGLEKALGTSATVRNWNTVTTLHAMCGTG